MSRQYCFLCASDEGVFLDITVENKQTFCEQFEICSLVKVPTSDELPIKICHKCAYELNQCSTFLQKYKKAIKQKTQNRGKQCCSICRQHTKKEYTFDLSKENSLQETSIDKLQKIFNDEVDKFQGNHKFICLSCRYIVDVLCDLKNLSAETASKLENIINKKIDYSNFPQVKTTVVSRKTTITESARATLKATQDSDTDSETMTRTRSKNKANDKLNNKVTAKSKEQVCEGCQNPFKSDKDAYRIERIGQSMCKICWENKCFNAKDAETSQSSAETKVCKVFLKDVLSSTSTRKGKLYKVEEDNQGKKKYRVTDKTGKKSPNASSDTESDIGKQGEKRLLKTTNFEDTDDIDKPHKKVRRSVKDNATESESAAESVQPRLTRNRRVIGNKYTASQNSDSDSVWNSTNKREGRLTKNKRLKNSDINDESSTDDNTTKKKKLRIANHVTITIDLTNTTDDDEKPKRSKSTRSNANQEKAILASAKKPVQKAEFSEPVEKIINDSDTNTYSCEECGVNYENKVVFLTHKLTHYKQLKLELERFVENKVEVQVHSSQEVDDQCEDQSEAIVIRVDDDEEETGLKENNADVNNEENLSSQTEDEANSLLKKEVSKETADAESVAKEVENDNEQSSKPEKYSKGRSLSRRNKSNLSDSDRNNTENIPEVTEEEAVEDISLTHIDDDQEEEDKEKEKENNIENEEKEKKKDEETDTSKGAEEIKERCDEGKTEHMEKVGETVSEDTSIELKINKDVSEDVANVEKSKSLEKTDETTNEGKDKLDSTDKTKENEVDKKEDFRKPEKSEDNEIKKKEKFDSFEKSEEEEVKENSEEEEMKGKSEEEEMKEKSEEEETKEKSKEEETKGKSEEEEMKEKSEKEETKEKSKEEETKGKSEEEETKEKSEEEEMKEKSEKEETKGKSEEEEMKGKSEEEEMKEKSEEEETKGKSEEEETKGKSEEEEMKEKSEEKEMKGKSEEEEMKEKSEEKDKPNCSEEFEGGNKLDSCKKSEGDKTDFSEKSAEADSSVNHDEKQTNEEKKIEGIVETNSEDSSDDVQEVIQKESDDEIEVQCTQKIVDKSIESSYKIVAKNNKTATDVHTSEIDIMEIDSLEQAKQSTDSADAAAEILQEVLDLASAEVQKRQDVIYVNGENDSGEAETLENISREVQNGGNTSRLLESNTSSAINSL